MAHVELSLSGLAEPTVAERPLSAPEADTALDRWAFVVARAEEPCVVISHNGVVVAASAASADVFSVRPSDAVGRLLVDGVLQLFDFNTVSGELPEWEVDKIPPLLAIRSGVLARGLLRVSTNGVPQTVDAISTPLRDLGRVVGSLTFFAPVGR
jgi:hypothetical protein